MCYGILVINLYGREHIKMGMGLMILFSYIIALICLMIKAETIMKYCDPVNINNRKKYIVICTLEFLEMIIAAFFAQVNNINDNISLQVSFAVVTVIILICSVYLHKGIIEDYEKIKHSTVLNKKIKDYSEAIECNNVENIDELFKNFCKFTIYIILLIFIYKYTLYHWILTCMFIFLNVLILWKLHWTGIKELVKSKYAYFIVVSIVSSLGIVLLKLIYDKVIILNIFQNRDEQEYLMVLVLFFSPLIYYGSKLSVIYMNKKNKWVE